MRRQDPQLISQLLGDIYKEMQLDGKLGEYAILNQWEAVAGPTVARYTQEKYIRNKKLHVKIASSIVKHELLLNRSNLIGRLNQITGTETIIDIIFF